MYGRQIKGRRFISREKDFSFLKAFFMFNCDLSSTSWNKLPGLQRELDNGKQVEADPENVL